MSKKWNNCKETTKKIVVMYHQFRLNLSEDTDMSVKFTYVSK
jgi:hypothetical protein